MRLLAVVLVLLGTWVNAAYACSCGAASGGGNFPGIIPQFHQNTIGLRWNHAGSDVTILTDGRRIARHDYNSVELWVRYYPVRRLQLMLSLPAIFNRKTDRDVTEGVNGIGDLLLEGRYMLARSSDSSCSPWKHVLLVGGGIKVPTGRHDLKSGGELISPALQPGSGSVDFTVNTTYTIRYRQLGMQADFSYRVNLPNRLDYRYGNRLGSALQLFYWIRAGRMAILPNAGVFAEYFRKDRQKDVLKYNSGGSMIYATSGADLYYGRIALGFTFRQPVFQKQAYGEVQSKASWQLHASVFF
ncbi:MAG: hypothetical protein KatS3mg031_1423 [Chitinophagales bacterium]|nr:MAG: hypothetical protein KatS3mg031_1423 [Chitinophagales bacterium]